MQIDPIKPALKAPVTKRLKLIYVGPLSNLAFEFNLRRYTKGVIVAGFFGGQGVATFGGNDTLTTAGEAARMLSAAS